MTYKYQIIVSKNFTDSPGARDVADGDNSGEEFYQKLLRPLFTEALTENEKLFIDLDNVWGYASSFIGGAFGRLADEFGPKKAWDNLVLKCDDNPLLKELISNEINSRGQ